jgi:hypothetical protein
MLPDSEIQLSGCAGDRACTVAPGNVVTVSIKQATTNNWVVSLTNKNHWSWSKRVHYASKHDSAEWILEAPTVVVQTIPAPIGVAHFGPTNTYTAGGVTRRISAGNPVMIAEGPGLINLATPSALGADGQSFNVCTYAQSCPRP